MASKQCDKCGEAVDEAKAFCSGCGNAFVVERQRDAPSNFESMDNTVQFGQTAYNMMLSDMGLNISKSQQPAEKKVEVLAPLPGPAAAPRPQPMPVPVPQQRPAPSADKPKSNVKWLILAGIVLLFLALVVIIGAGVLVYYFGPR